MPIPAVTRTGVSTWVGAIALACRMFHNPRFQKGLRDLIGTEAANPLITSFQTFCIAFEAYLATDDFPFKIDYTPGEPVDQDPGA